MRDYNYEDCYMFPTAVAYKVAAGEVALANTSIKYKHKEKKNYYILFSVFLPIFTCVQWVHVINI